MPYAAGKNVSIFILVMIINFSVRASLIALAAVGCAAEPRPKPELAVAVAPAGILKISARNDTSLMWLAHVWSGGQTEARCRNTVGHDVVLLPGERYCELFSSTRGVVGLQINTAGLVYMVFWDRLTSGHPDAQAVTDSLDTLLRSHGLTGRACDRSGEPMEAQSTVWESPALLVYLSRITQPGQQPKLVVVAINEPEEFPAGFCMPATKTVSPAT